MDLLAVQGTLKNTLMFFTLKVIVINLYFYYLLTPVLGLCCCVQAFSSCSDEGATFYCGARAPHFSGFSYCGTQALALGLSTCGPQAELLHGMWNLPKTGIKSMSPALPGGFLSTVPPGKYHLYVNISDVLFIEKCFPKQNN